VHGLVLHKTKKFISYFINGPAKIEDRTIQRLGKFVKLICYPKTNIHCLRRDLNVWQNEDIGHGQRQPEKEADEH
jgi:hypothetical protein